MNTIYIGDVTIEEVPGAKLRLKRGKAGVLTRPYRGNVSDLVAFINDNLILSNDYQYPSMVLDSLEATWNGPEAEAILTYYGLPGGPNSSPVDLQSDAAWFPKSTVLGTNVAADGLWTVNYKSPTVTYRYNLPSRLSNPQYQSYSEMPSDITITNARQFSIPGGGPLNPAFVRSGDFQFQVFSVCDSFERRQKGNVYDYEETWATIIQQDNGQGLSNSYQQVPL